MFPTFQKQNKTNKNYQTYTGEHTHENKKPQKMCGLSSA